MKKILFWGLLILVIGSLLIVQCKKEELSGKKEILSLNFLSNNNPQLERNYIGSIAGTIISVEVPFGTNTTILVPSIEISPKATVNPVGDVETNFTSPVNYTVTAEDKTTKTFTATVAIDEAPYIGTWKSGPIDFGSGLMKVTAIITKNGDLTLLFAQILTNEKESTSIKGHFNPISRQNTEIELIQTQRWINNDWVDESGERTIMYKINTPQSLKLYYSLNYPKDTWLFEINLTKE